MTLDMTKGNPFPIILKFMIPLFIGNVFQQLYNMADTIIVGRFVGADALAAVGATGTIMFLVLGFSQGLCTGFTVLTSQVYGAQDYARVKRSVANGILLAAIVIVVMTTLSVSMMRPLLHLMNTPANIFEDAHTYISIICMGTIASVYYNLFSAYLRAVGNSKVPLCFLVFSACLNVVLDLFFIIGLKLGVAGAALATDLSQGISAVLCLLYIYKKEKVLWPERHDWHINSSDTQRQMSVGVPMALQYSITAIGTMMVQSALNMLGSYAVAAFTAGSKIEQIFTQAYVAQGTASATYNAQNIGAGKLERVREGFRASHFIGIVYSVVVGSFLFFAGKYFAYLFISDYIEEVLPMVAIYVKCVALFFIPLYFVNVLRNGIQGMGYGLLPMMAGVAELAGRGITATIAAGKSSYIGTCLASPVAWIFASVLLWVMYFYVMKDMARKLYGTNKL